MIILKLILGSDVKVGNIYVVRLLVFIVICRVVWVVFSLSLLVKVCFNRLILDWWWIRWVLRGVV